MDAAQKEMLIDRFKLASFVEACRLHEEKVATVKDIDLAMLAGAGYVQGPFAMADHIGLDTVLEKLEALERQYGEAYAVPKTLRDLVSKGSLGVKSGRGFYEY